MSAQLPYAHILRRRPAQARSAERVEALLDAAAELLRDREPDAITVRDLAAAAGVPTGTLYQFFEDKDAVLQALAVRFLAAMPGVLDASIASGRDDWSHTVGQVVDAYAAMVREHPAIRRLWLSGTLDAATRLVERATDATIAARLGALLRTQAGSRRGTPEQWRTLVALIDALLVHAFTEDPDGDPLALREARRAARAYAGAVLGLTPA
ncbi:MAG TPA: TetR/AcrR family transcriptional regulator [Solirubrobacteraceae bacterium]